MDPDSHPLLENHSGRKSQVAIGFLKNTGTEMGPLEKQWTPLGQNDSLVGTARPIVKNADDLNVVRTPSPDPMEFSGSAHAGM